MHITDINKALDYIYSFINLENGQSFLKKDYSLDNIKKLLMLFDNPHFNKKIIHLAGTKGKGSTTLMISRMLYLNGKTVSSFVSPHLIKLNERILFQLNPISDQELIELTERIRIKLDGNNIVPTTFELLFLIFLLYSQEKNADYLVIETGLGGRLDTTNVIEPLISVLTPISFDHTNILGKTIKEIANEKAGIIKDNSFVVVSEQPFYCEKIFRKTADKKNAKIFFTKKIINIKKIDFNDEGLNFSLKINNEKISKEKISANVSGSSKQIKNLNIKLHGFYGKHQADNFNSALLTILILGETGFLVKCDTIALKNLINGRIEVLKRNPLIILDVSHNGDSALKLVNALKKHFKINKINILSGMSIDKDYDTFYKNLKNIAQKCIITTPKEFKKSDPQSVFKTASKYIKNTLFINNINEAFEISMKNDENLLVTGSFYVAGPFLEYFKNLSEK